MPESPLVLTGNDSRSTAKCPLGMRHYAYAKRRCTCKMGLWADPVLTGTCSDTLANSSEFVPARSLSASPRFELPGIPLRQRGTWGVRARGLSGLSQGSFMPDRWDRTDEQGSCTWGFAKDRNRGGFEALLHEDVTGDVLFYSPWAARTLEGFFRCFLNHFLVSERPMATPMSSVK
jgi:hypothetical protein